MKPFLLAATLLALPATAAFAADDPIPRIIVSGSGTVSVAPDRAVIDFGLHGEGATSDEAVAAMAAKRKAVEGGIASVGGSSPPRAAQMAVVEVRGRDCTRNGNFGPKLSTGDCAIIGYTADVQMEIRTTNVKDSGTLVGLIGRLGGTNPRINRYYLADDAPTRARALAAAIADARTQADAIAAGAHVTLGRIISVSNGNYGVQQFAENIVVTGNLIVPAAPPPPPPVAVALTPRQIDTQARVQVVFAIGG